MLRMLTYLGPYILLVLSSNEEHQFPVTESKWSSNYDSVMTLNILGDNERLPGKRKRTQRPTIILLSPCSLLSIAEEIFLAKPVRRK